MEDNFAIAIVVLMFLVKSPWVWASAIGFAVAFKLHGKDSNAKKYLLSGCAVIFVASTANVLLNLTMPSVWDSQGLEIQDISRMIVRYNRVVDIVSASGLLLIVRAVFVSQNNSDARIKNTPDPA